jgi:hypothetical protein
LKGIIFIKFQKDIFDRVWVERIRLKLKRGLKIGVADRLLRQICHRRRIELAFTAQAFHSLFPRRGNGHDNLDLISTVDATLHPVFGIRPC